MNNDKVINLSILGIKTIKKVAKTTTKVDTSREKQLKQIMYNATFEALKNEPEFVELSNENVYKVDKHGEGTPKNINGRFLAIFNGECYELLEPKAYFTHFKAIDLRNPKCVKMVTQNNKQ